MRLKELIGRTARRLARARLHYGHGTDNPRDEAAFLVLRGLGLPFDADLECDVDPARVEPLVRRRISKRLPTAYILGEAWLAGLLFHVDHRVIVPRSHIAALLAKGLRPWVRRPVRRVLDLCTGSGCLAVLAARAFPRASVEASDLSRAALAVAKKNVTRHGLEQRIRLVQSDLFNALQGRYDLIVTNPPYVREASMRRLPAEFRHEPPSALSGGRDGLDIVHRILGQAGERLTPGGVLVCEVGDRQRALERACPQVPFVWPQPEVFVLEPSRTAVASGTRSRPARGRR